MARKLGMDPWEDSYNSERWPKRVVGQGGGWWQGDLPSSSLWKSLETLKKPECSSSSVMWLRSPGQHLPRLEGGRVVRDTCLLLSPSRQEPTVTERTWAGIEPGNKWRLRPPGCPVKKGTRASPGWRGFPQDIRKCNQHDY